MTPRHAVFEPYQSRGRVRFFLQRPTGYMSAYTWRSARASIRTSLRIQGSRDPLYVSLFGRNPIRLPSLRGPVAPRKTRCTTPTKSGARCTALTGSTDSICHVHQVPATADATPHTSPV